MNLMRLRNIKQTLLVMNGQAWDAMRDDIFALLTNDQAQAVLQIIKKHAKEQ